MAKKQAKFNVGDKVWYVRGGWFKRGEILYVLEYRPRSDMYLLGKEPWMTYDDIEALYVDEEDIELVEPTVSLADELATLKRRVAELEAKVAELEAPITASIAESTPHPNTERKMAIEDARDFVAEITSITGDGYYHQRRGRGFRHPMYVTKTEFVVNEEKRTVVAIVRGAVRPIVVSRGIAKCDPSDVFNADIGKAIALGRAYGLDVSRFEQAPQPDEVVAGMTVMNVGRAGGTYEITAVKNGNLYIDASGVRGRYFEDYNGRIIADTEAQY